MKKWHFIVAAIFLFNPIFSTLDILPDFVGYLLLLKAFSKMSYIDDKAEDVCRSMKIMSLITVFKPLAFFLVPSLDTTMYLVFSFVFALLETIFGIGALIKVFDCLSDYSLSYGDSQLAENKKIKIFSLVMLISKVTLAFIPDLTFLAISDGVSTPSGIDFTRFRPVLFVLTAIISLVIGTIWLVLSIRYFAKLCNKSFQQTMDIDFRKKTDHRKTLFLSKKVMTILVILSIASIFVIDFNFQYVNILLDSIFSIAIAIAFIYLSAKGYFKDKLSTIIVSVASIIHLIFDIILTSTAITFFEKYNLNSIQIVSEAEDMYFKMCTFATISAILSVVIIIVSILAIRKNSLLVVNDNIELFGGVNREDMIKEYSEETLKQVLPVIVTGVLSSITYVCYISFRHLATATTIINSIAEIAFVIFFIKAISYIKDNVFKRLWSLS